MPLSPTPALLSEALRLTGITLPALARKLGVPGRALQAAAAGEGELSPAAREALGAFCARARQAGSSAPAGPLQPVTWALHEGDAGAVLRGLPEASIDAIVTDIPYGISHEAWDVLHPNTNAALLGASEAQRRAGKVFEKRRKPINGWAASDREIPRQYEAWCRTWAPEWLRVLKPGGSALVFAGRRFMPRCVVALEDAGFNHRDLLAWLKPRAPFRAQPLATVLRKRGDLAAAEQHAGWRLGSLAPVFEPIVWAFKPYEHTLADAVLTHGVGAMQAEAYRALVGTYDNVIRAGLAPGEGGLHPAQKPLALMEALIALTVPTGGVVLDPFAGSGTTGVAAVRRGCSCVLVEQDARLCAVIAARLSAEAAPSP